MNPQQLIPEQIEMTYVKNIQPGDKNISIEVILYKYLGFFNLKNDKKLYQFQVGDDTGSIRCNFYDDCGSKLKESDVVRLVGAYASIYQNRLTLYTAKEGYGQVIKTGEFFFTYSETPDLSVPINDENENERDKKSRQPRLYQK